MLNKCDLFDFSPIPMWIYDTRDLRILAANKAACEDYGYTTEEFVAMTVDSLWPEEDKADMFKQVENKGRKGLVNKGIVRHKTVNGDILDVEITSQPLPAWGEHARVIMGLDVTDKIRLKHAGKLVGDFDLLEKNILAINSKKESTLRQVLTAYLEGIESLFPQLACSVMRVKNNRVYNWASPSLPSFLIEELEGVEINERAGSCGTAAFLKQKVIVTDIANDERWENYKDVTLKAGFLACWSYPLISSEQKVMATFAIYSRQTGIPGELERMVIERATGLLIIILENRLFAEMLAETHNLMQQSQDLAQFGNWSWDIVDNVVSWSDTLYTIYGINKNNFKATFEGYQELLHPEDRERVTRIIWNVLQDKKDVEFEERIIRPNGEIRPLRSWGTLKCDEDGKPIKMIGACLDVSDWKKTERQLQESNERYEYISKASKDAVFDLDFIKDHINWGDGFLRVFGYPSNESKFCLADWTKLVHPDDGIQLKTDLQQAINDPEKVSWSSQYRLRHINGYYLYVEGTGYILRDGDGVATRMIGVLRDVTERQETAKALAASEKRYSDLFHLNPLPMWVYDIVTYRFLDVNEAAMQVYGYTKDEFLAMTIMDIRFAEDVPNLDDQLKHNLKPGKFHATIVRHLKKNGDVMIVNANGNSIFYKDYEARLIVAIDITEKIRTQEDLQKSERRFKQLIQEGSDLITILNEDGSFKYVSPTAERLLGATSKELIGEYGFSFVHKADRERVDREIKKLALTKRVELKPFRIVDHQQDVRWLETIVTDMRHDEAIAGIITNARDVTQRIIAESKNKETLERYNIVNKATSDTIWDCNFQTNEVKWSRGIKHTFGYEDAEGTYSWWQEHVHPDDLQKINDIVTENIKIGKARWSSEYRFRCADGNYKVVFDRGFLMFDNEGKAVRMIGAMQDITERMNYIQKIEDHNSKLKEIAWTQAHLVRSPLARIMGITDLLKTGENDSDTHHELLGFLETSAIELDNIVKTIINKSQ